MGIGFDKLLEFLHSTSAFQECFDRMFFLISMILFPPIAEGTDIKVSISNNFISPEYVNLVVNILEETGNILRDNANSTDSNRILRIYQVLLSGITHSTVQQVTELSSAIDSTGKNIIELFCAATGAIAHQYNLSMRLLGETLHAFSQILRLKKEYILKFADIYQNSFSLPQLVVLMGSKDDILFFQYFCKFLRVIFFVRSIQIVFSSSHGFNELARAIYRALGYLRSSNDAKLAILEATNFLVGAAQVKTLQSEIVLQCVLPVVIKLIQSEAPESILVPALGFIYFMSTENNARVELIDSPDIDYLIKLMKSPGNNSKVAVAAKECYTALGGVSVLCTISNSGLEQYQEHFSCKTCGLNSICVHCAQICHYNHSLTSKTTSQVVCRCGTSDYCLIKKRPSL